MSSSSPNPYISSSWHFFRRAMASSIRVPCPLVVNTDDLWVGFPTEFIGSDLLPA